MTCLHLVTIVSVRPDSWKYFCSAFKSYHRKPIYRDFFTPSYVTQSFPKLLKANGFRHIRFHDLRHSCASLLLKNGVPMKQIQEWLGHSDFSTTANIYAHLDCSSKLISADAMLNGLGMDSK